MAARCLANYFDKKVVRQMSKAAPESYTVFSGKGGK